MLLSHAIFCCMMFKYTHNNLSDKTICLRSLPRFINAIARRAYLSNEEEMWVELTGTMTTNELSEIDIEKEISTNFFIILLCHSAFSLDTG